MNRQKVVFCFPYLGVGGVSLLFSRLAKELSKAFDVYVVDYKDGFMASNIIEGVKLITYSDDDYCEIPEKSTVIFQTMNPWTIFPMVKVPRNAKVLFWNCHPYNLVPSIPLIDGLVKKNLTINRFFLKLFLPSYWLKCSKFLNVLDKKRAIVMMDQPNLDVTEFFYNKISSRKFVRIPAVNELRLTHKPPFHSKGKRCLSVFWVGRIVDFKFSILEYTLSQLDRFVSKSSVKINFTIIGDGPLLNDLKKHADNLKYLEVLFVKHVDPEKLDNYLLENCDLNFAMGTSALESAKLGIPTVLLDFSFRKKVRNYKFRLIQERKGMSLGNCIDSKRHFEENPQESLVDIIEAVQNKEYNLSKETKQYFERYHSISSVAKELVEAICASDCYFKDIADSGVMSKGLLYKFKKKFLG